MKVKLGQKIVFNSDLTIKLDKGGTVLVKKGDVAQVVRRIDDTTGEVVYLTGQAAGKRQYMPMEVDASVDEDAIAKMIMHELNN